MPHPDNPHRWRELVYRAVESDTLDYKAPLSWKDLSRAGKAKFVRHCLALANTKGGYVVVGVGEDDSGRPVQYRGLTPEQSRSFDPSLVGAFINRCVEPPLDFTIERPVVDGKNYAIFVVRPFAQLPHVCSMGIADELQPGVFYIRTTDASSRPAYRAVEIQALIQRALRRQREMLSRMLRGLLFERRQETELDNFDRFDEEALHGRNFFRRRVKAAPCAYYLEMIAHPARFRSDFFTRSELAGAIDQVPRLAPQSDWYGANTSWRKLDEEAGKLEQFYRSGLFHTLERVERDSSYELRRRLTRAVETASRLYSAAGLVDEALSIEIRLLPCGWEPAPIRLRIRRTPVAASSDTLLESGWYGAIAWASAPGEHANELYGRLIEKFAPEEEPIPTKEPQP